MSDSQKLIQYAQSYLKKQPFDIVHDLEHHQLVVRNCEAIIQNEKLKPNLDVIMTAAWWHDVEKSYKTANSSDNTIVFFQKVAKELGIDNTFIELCSNTIKEHSFSGRQTSLESNILFDADKIEYVNDDRISKLVDDFVLHPSKYKPDQLQNTHDIWAFRITKVQDMMHFEYSKKVFQEKIAATESILEKFQRKLDSIKK